MKTLKSSFYIEGKGLMSGLYSSLKVNPSKERGIRFSVNGVNVPSALESVISTEHCVVLGGTTDGKMAKVALVEHFMAACAICGVDALDVTFHSEGFEMPIFDGSAKVWVDRFKEIGFEGEEEFVAPLKKPVVFSKGKSSVVLVPSDEPTNIVYSVNFDHPELKNRWADICDMQEIIEARTFGYLKDLEGLQKAGFSKGVTIENTVGLTEDGYTTELRSEFEPIKHKILDIIGDLYLTGVNPLKLKAKILVKEAGHALHVEAAKLLKSALRENI